MALKSPVVGLKWARLEVIAIEHEERPAPIMPWDDGAVLDPPIHEFVCTLQCTCGNKVVWDASDIDKRVMKTCGKCVENGPAIDDSGRVKLSRPGRPPNAKGRGAPLTVWVPISVIAQLEKLAQDKVMSLSAVVVEMISSGLENLNA